MAIAVPTPVTITPATNHSFDDLVTALASYSALTLGLFAQASGFPFRYGPGMVEKFSLPRLSERQGSSTLAVVFDPAAILASTKDGGWPGNMELRFEEAYLPPENMRGTPLSPQRRVTDNVIQHAFIAYWERNKDAIEKVWSIKGGGPAPLGFGWAVRNAFAHNGRIFFEKRYVGVTVGWRGLSFSIADNGEPVIGKHMIAGDVVQLMLDLDRLF
jgi:hypothetical protein